MDEANETPVADDLPSGGPGGSDGVSSLEALFERIDAEPAEATPEDADQSLETGSEPQEASEAPPPAQGTPEAPKAAQSPGDSSLKLLEQAASREREASAYRQRLEAAEATLAERERALAEREAKVAEWREFERALDEGDPLAALEARGYKFEDLAEAAAQARGVRPNRRVEEEIAKTRRELEEFRKGQQEEARRLQTERAWAEAREEARSEVAKRSPALAALGEAGVEEIIGLARQYHAAGYQPDYDTLVSAAEARVNQFLDRVMSVDSIRQKYLADTGSKRPGQRAPSPTVSNAHAGSVSRGSEKPDLLSLPKEEAVERLFREFSGQ